MKWTTEINEVSQQKTKDGLKKTKKQTKDGSIINQQQTISRRRLFHEILSYLGYLKRLVFSTHYLEAIPPVSFVFNSPPLKITIQQIMCGVWKKKGTMIIIIHLLLHIHFTHTLPHRLKSSF